MTEDKKIHPTHFQITKDMPWREKEKQAILLLKSVLVSLINKEQYDGFVLHEAIKENKDLVDWVMKYKGE